MANFTGTNGDDVLFGTNVPSPNTIADTFEPLEGNDSVNGLGGDDTITYEAGADQYDGSTEVDTIVIPENLDASKFVDSTGTIPGTFSGTFQGGKTGGDNVADFGYFYDFGPNDDGDGILAQNVELFQFDNFLFDARVSQILSAGDDAFATVGDAQGNSFPVTAATNVSVADGIPFTAGDTLDEGTFGALEDLTIIQVNGEAVSSGDTVELASGSTLDVLDQSTNEGQIDYTPGSDFLRSLTGPDYQIFLGMNAVDEEVTVRAADNSANTIDITFDVGVTFPGTDYTDNFRDSNINGNDSANTILGNGGDDYLSGGAGTDTLVGGYGDDTSFANNRESEDDDADVVVGGDGNDVLGGGAAGDLIIGDSANLAAGEVSLGGVGSGVSIGAGGIDYGADSDDGSDQLFGSVGNDVILTGGVIGGVSDIGPGDIVGFADDTAYGGEGNDSLVGAGGSDSLFGSSGDDDIAGLGGPDNLGGGPGDDVIEGDGGRDTVSGADGDDDLFGGGLADVLFGGAGNDELEGNAGQDSLWAGTGDDELTGGAGDDDFVFVDDTGSTNTITDFGDGDDEIDLSQIGGLSFGDLTITDDGTDSTVTVPSGTGNFDIVVEGTTTLDADDFIF